MAYFKKKDFANLKRIGNNWKALKKSAQDDLRNNLKQLKKLSSDIQSACPDFYTASTVKPNSTPGQYHDTKVIMPWINIFPRWMKIFDKKSGKYKDCKAGSYEIGFLLFQDCSGLKLSIDYCINHYKNKPIPSAISIQTWDKATIITMNEDYLVNDIVDACKNNVNQLITLGFNN